MNEPCPHIEVSEHRHCIACGEYLYHRYKEPELSPYQERPRELPTCHSALGVEWIEISLPTRQSEVTALDVDMERVFEFYV